MGTAVVALTLGACGGGTQPGSTPTHEPPPRAAVASPQLMALRAGLAAPLRAAGSNTGAIVVDLNTGQVLFSSAPDVKREPASVEKLYTTVAIVRWLGADARLETKVLGTGHLGPGGLWHGDLYLRGGGDPTFGDSTFVRVWDRGAGATAQQLVAQLAGAGVRRVTGRVIGDDSLFDSRRGGPSSGFAPDIADIGGQLSGLTYDHGAATGSLTPGAFAARELTLTMRGAHIRASASTVTGVTPSGAQTLASVRSAPMSVLLRLMDVPSDDFFAEMLTKQLGARTARDGTTAAGIRAIGKTIASYGIHPVVVDGSGLSRANRSSPHEVVNLLGSLWSTPTGRVLNAALPLVGVEGTVRHIGVGTVAQGRCIAKTGTLSDVTNLAGYCHSADHHVLAFAVFLDGPDNHRGIQLLSRMVAAMVRY